MYEFRSALIPLSLGALLLAGCSRTVVTNPLATDYGAGDPDGEVAFWHSMPPRSAITNNEGMHAILILSDGTDPTSSYEERVALLQERGWLPEGFNEQPNLAMQRGRFASLAAHALGIDGGVMMRLTDKAPRYATRELEFLNLIGPGTEREVLSGLELLGTVAKLEDYRVREEVLAARAAEAARPPAEAAPNEASEPAAEPATEGEDDEAADA
ncbi:MAG: hypothetical protein AAGD00_04225 [Planctomycetota bacterium]